MNDHDLHQMNLEEISEKKISRRFLSGSFQIISDLAEMK